jgi:hypothetical protein
LRTAVSDRQREVGSGRKISPLPDIDIERFQIRHAT